MAFFFFNTETEIGNASGTDGSVQPHGKAILIKLKYVLREFDVLSNLTNEELCSISILKTALLYFE